ncbi:MAG: carboxypeptidase regulatory-like domain-containing protein, partial [Acidobacteriota bacterium]|nr:carboxypeptidase regulatory-like domain-containing protein [Acidobacteriota bacterium]
GSIAGTVVDASGAAMPGVTITVVNQLRNNIARTVTTNSVGNYFVPDLAVGTYSVRAGKTGFVSQLHSNLVLNVRSSVRVNFTLAVGAVTQQITVTAPTIHLQTETGALSHTIAGSHVAEIDTDGRNFVQLATLVPGMAGQSLVGSLNVPVGVTANTGLNSNGERQAHNVFTVDGQQNYDRGCGGCMEVIPDQDAIQEFNVLSSNAGTDVGFGSGAHIQLELKSGTSSYHGEAFEFNRNTALTAGNYFNNAANKPKPPLIFNDFGFNLGGPIALPGHTKKTFFFFEMDWRKIIQGATYNTAAPLSSWTTGDFSASSPVILDKTKPVACPAGVAGSCYTPFPNNQIPSPMLNSNAVILAAPNFIFPSANSGTNFVGSASAPINVNEQIVRIDHQFSDKTSLMAHYIRNGINQNFPTTLWSSDSYPTVGTDFLNEPQAVMLKLTRSISPSLLNEAMVAFSRQPLTLLPTGNFKRPSNLTIGQIFPGNQDNRIPTLSFASPMGTAFDLASWPWTNVYQNWQFRDSATKIWGNHTLNFGAEFMHYFKQQELFGNTQGNFRFDSQASALGTGGQYIDPSNPGKVLTTNGNSFADFMLGNAYTYSELQTQGMPTYINNFFGPWVGDAWKARNGLTINLGLRWEYMPHAYEQHGNIAVFRPALYNTADTALLNPNGAISPASPGLQNINGTEMYLNGMGLQGKNGIPKILVDNHLKNFEPRLGFAWQPHAGGKTVIRGGYGLFFENIQGNDIYNVAPNPPFSNSPQVFNTNLTTPGGTASINPSSIRSYDPAYLQPYSEQWSVGVQRQFNSSTMFSLMYVGSESTHQQLSRNINQPTAPVPSGTNINLARVYPGYAGFTWYENSVNSNYNSLQASLRFSNWHGFTSGLAYTYSHCLDYQDNDNAGNINNAYNVAAEYGNCGFDIRHMLVINYVYSLPIFNHATGVKRTMLGGWQLSGITTFYSGIPLTVGIGGDSARCGCGGYRANLIGAPNSGPKTLGEWFNTAAFGPLTAGDFGDGARNIVYGAGINNWDVSLFKNFAGIPFPVNKEGATLQVRLETFNTFNTTQWNRFGTGFGNGNFGKATGTRLPREIQLGAKFIF